MEDQIAEVVEVATEDIMQDNAWALNAGAGAAIAVLGIAAGYCISKGYAWAKERIQKHKEKKWILIGKEAEEIEVEED